MTQNSSSSSSESTESKPLPAWVRPVIEFSPLIIFFVVQRSTRHLDDLGGLYWATISLMITTTVSVIASRIIEKRWPALPLITGLVVGVMGGLTIYMNSELFIKIKPTIVNAILGALLLGGLATGRLFLRNVLGKNLPMAEEGWRILTGRMVLYFFALAVGNEILRRVLNTDDWTTAKTFGFGPAGFIFLLAQSKLIERHWTGDRDGQDSKETTDSAPE